MRCLSAARRYKTTAPTLPCFCASTANVEYVFGSTNALHQSPRPYADLQTQHFFFNFTSSIVFCAIQ